MHRMIKVSIGHSGMNSKYFIEAVAVTRANKPPSLPMPAFSIVPVVVNSASSALRVIAHIVIASVIALT